jgi:hypothetical protein
VPPPTRKSFGLAGRHEGRAAWVLFGNTRSSWRWRSRWIYAYVPLTRDDIAKLRWLDDINVIVSKSLAPAKPEAGVSRVDPIAAANVDEDLDYRIAQRMKSTEGWRSFLAAHPDGPHAQSARAEIDKLVPVETRPAPVAVQASNGGSSDTKTPSELASPDLTSPPREVATLTSDEICKRDEDRLERLSNSPTSCLASAPLRQIRGFQEGRISGSS